TVTIMWSTRRARRKLVMMRAPPSTITLEIPSPANHSSNASRSTRPRGSEGNRTTRAPACSSAAEAPGAAASVVATTGRRVGCERSRALVGVRARESTTTGIGSGPSTRRTVRRGSSDSTVPTPTRIASCAARSMCVRSCASHPLNARGRPRRTAMQPSRLWAYVSVMKGVDPSSRWAAIRARSRSATSSARPRPALSRAGIRWGLVVSRESRAMVRRACATSLPNEQGAGGLRAPAHALPTGSTPVPCRSSGRRATSPLPAHPAARCALTCSPASSSEVHAVQETRSPTGLRHDLFDPREMVAVDLVRDVVDPERERVELAAHGPADPGRRVEDAVPVRRGLELAHAILARRTLPPGRHEVTLRLVARAKPPLERRDLRQRLVRRRERAPHVRDGPVDDEFTGHPPLGAPLEPGQYRVPVHVLVDREPRWTELTRVPRVDVVVYPVPEHGHLAPQPLPR